MNIGMIVSDLRILLILLLTRGTRPTTARRPSESPPGTTLPENETPLDPENPDKTDRTALGPPTTETISGTYNPSERNRTETHHPSEPNKSRTNHPSEPKKSETDSPSELNRSGTNYPSEPNRIDVILEQRRSKIQLKPNRTHTNSVSKFERTETHTPSEPNRTETHSPSEPNRTETHSPSEPNRTETHSPSETNRTETYSSSEPNRTETDAPSEPNRNETHSPSEPNRIETYSSSEPNRTETDSPSEPNRTETHSSSEPNRTETDAPSEPNRTETDTASEPNRTETHHPSEPNRTEADAPSEPNRTETDAPSEPNRTETLFPSEPNRTETDAPSEPNRTDTHPPSEPNRTETDALSEPNRTGTHPPSEPNRSETHSPSEPNRTDSDTLSEPNRTETHSPSEPNRTENHSHSEPNRTETDAPSEPNKSETDSPSEPNRTETYSPSEAHRGEDGLLFVADKETAQTVSEPDLIGRQNFYRWDSRTETDFTRTDGQTSSASGITQKSVTRRHISKRTPHMDTTYVSSTLSHAGDLSSVTNNTNVSDITGHPTASTTHLDSGLTDIGTAVTGPATEDSGNTTQGSGGMTQVSVTRAKDSGNTTEGSVTIPLDSGNSTETSGINKTDLGLSSSVTFPLQTPSYLMTTYPSPTSHQVSESSSPFTSVPVTAPNTTSNVHSTDGPSSGSTFVSTSPPSTNSSSSTFPASSSESPSSPFDEAGTISNHSSSDVSSSSPIPSTFLSSTSATFSTSPSEASPNFTSTKPSAPQTTLLTTPSLPSLPPSVPPSEPTTSSADENIETSTAHRTSSPLARTEQTSGAYNSPTSGPSESYTTEAGQRFINWTSTAYNVATLRPDPETQTSVTPLKDGGMQTIATTTHVTEPPAQPTSLIPMTTRNLPIPSPHFTTQDSPPNIPETTSPRGPTLTTQGPSKQVTTIRTTSVDIKSIMPKVETTISNKEKKIPARSTAQPGVVTAKPPTTTTATNPPTPPHPAPPRPTPPAPVSVCSPNPCHNGGSCTQRRGHQNGYKCECPRAWQGQHCDTDVDECLSRPCPAQATCVNLRGSFTCRCPLGYIMEKGASCVQVRTFLGHIEVPRSFLNGSNGKYTKLQQIEEEIVQILNSSFSVIGGYYQSSVTNSSFSNRIQLSIQNIFLLSSNVTIYDLRHNIQRYKKECQSAPERSPTCQLMLHPQLYYIAISLCNMKNPGCDNETAECADPAGITQCQCKAGYFKYSTTDRSCRACDDGYKLQDGACVRCPFGLGGFNCSNPYQLITVIISAAGGGLLLILGIALAVTCSRKSKHDISKLIFKSGDFQMSPYAEYPKAQRSTEWGRETIEMQENGSTKNLLQMTDVYYSPGLRNPEMERNGLYPYSGLPGSRHSCIYPGQYNPTFINEENRRRDYF